MSKKLYGCLEYHNPSSKAVVRIFQESSPCDALSRMSIHTRSKYLTGLGIKFDLDTHHQYWSSPGQLEHEQTHTKSVNLRLFGFRSIPDRTFYRIMQDNLDNWGEEFDRNYRHVVIHDMIGKVREIIDDECNKGLYDLDVCVRVTLDVHHSQSIPLLVKKMEVDENAKNDDCIICLEELGKERELMCMPCSHAFHGDCITTWLENGHSCPVCRHDLCFVQNNKRRKKH